VKILFTRFPFESANGGAENQTTVLMKGLIDRGHEVSFLGSCPVLLDRCEKLSVVGCRLSVGKPPVTKWDAISFLWRKWNIRKKLIATLRTENLEPTTIVMLSLTEKILLTPYAVSKGIKVCWIEHDTVGDWLAKNPSLSQLQHMSENVTTICVSDLSADIFRSLEYKNVIGIPNGVDLPPDNFTKHDFDETLRVGCIARLSKEKGVDVLVEAMRMVDNATLLINGKGDEYIQSSATVSVKAEVPDVNDVYKEIDVLVLPSRKEDPFGLVVAEAMLRGIPTICTDACGIARYLSDNSDTLIVPAGSSQALAAAINQMQDTATRSRIGKTGKRTAEEKFTTEKMIDNYEKVLNV
jgi:glycosyltransferase involved in cell wall biosynthesis